MSTYEKIKSIVLNTIKLKINDCDYMINKDFISDSKYLLKFFDKSLEKEQELKIYDHCGNLVENDVMHDIMLYLYEGKMEKIRIENYKIKYTNGKIDFEFNKNNIKLIITYLKLADFMSIDSLMKLLENYMDNYFFCQLLSDKNKEKYYGINEIEFLNTYYTRSDKKDSYLNIFSYLINNAELDENQLVEMLCSYKYNYFSQIVDISRLLYKLKSTELENKKWKFCQNTINKLKRTREENPIDYLQCIEYLSKMRK